MKKCVVISDSFKGSMTSSEIGLLAKKSIKKFFPECEVIAIPVADGGEGTVACMNEILGGKLIKSSYTGPLWERLEATYCIKNDTAVIETAACAGLPLVENNKNPLLTTTYGVGEQILSAINNGAREIILGLGGSATNDGGCGCASALGVKFHNAEGREFIPTGGTLKDIEKIDVSRCKELFEGIKLAAMCDIDNPMCGRSGAAFVFAPQKGADEAMVKLLDEGLVHLSDVIKRDLGVDVSSLPGAGAAGGFGAGCVAFFGGELIPGIEAVLNAVSFDELLNNCDAVFTGEGKIDSQSLRGKVVIGVAKRAKKKNVPVYAIVGDVCDDAYGAYDMGVTAMFSINRLAIPFSQAKRRSKEDYTHTLEDVLRLIHSL